MLAVAFVSVAACSSGTSTPPPGNGKTSKTSTPGKPTPTKLKKETGKHAIKNVFAKTPSGDKVSLASPAPGHEVLAQIFDATDKTWSAPTTVYKDDARFCHAIKLKSVDTILAATVVCSISAQDTSGTQSSYALASTDGKTWKRDDLTGAMAGPSISPGGKFVSWTASQSFLLWSPAGSFATVKYTQDVTAPTIGLIEDDGTLVMIKASAVKKNCTIAILSASSKATTPKAISSIPPQTEPKCIVSSAKFQGSEIIANFKTTATTKIGTKKSSKTTTFADAFVKESDGKWAIKS